MVLGQHLSVVQGSKN
jgi:glycerol uptake facilitator-like aquaporin